MKIRRFITTAAAVSFAAMVAAGCGNSVPKDAICNVNGDPVKLSEFDRIIAGAKKSYAQQKQDFPKAGSPEYKQLRNQAVDYLIEQNLFRQQAGELGVKVSDKAVNSRLKQIKQNFFKGDQKQYQKELKKQNLTEAQVKSNIKQTLLTEKVYEKVTKNIKVSEAKAKQQFDENPSQYEDPEQRDVAHILVKTKAEADKIYAQVKGGDEKVFAKLAKAKSQDPSSAQNGGTLTVSRGQTVPEFDKMAFSLKTGEISKPVKTQFGYHIISARGDIKPKHKKTFKEVKTQIISTLEQEKRSERMQNWRNSLRKKAEKNVTCRKGYVWTQTVKSTSSTQAPAPTPDTKSTTEKKKVAVSKADVAKTVDAVKKAAAKSDTSGK